MAKRRYNPRLAKIHRSYTIEKVANLYDVHKNTIRTWIKNGLLTCDSSRPTLILGRHLREFLEQQRKKNKKPCPAGTIYCVSCKEPRKPSGGMVDYLPTSDTRGRLIGNCPICNHKINQITSFSKLDQIEHIFDVTIRQVE
jgi:hypothetical protein